MVGINTAQRYLKMRKKKPSRKTYYRSKARLLLMDSQPKRMAEFSNMQLTKDKMR